MNIQKFTQNSLQAVQNCEKYAGDYGHQQIEQIHLFYALLDQTDGLIGQLVEKMGLDRNAILERVEQILAGKPKVAGAQIYLSQDLNKVLTHAEDEPKQPAEEEEATEEATAEAAPAEETAEEENATAEEEAPAEA